MNKNLRALISKVVVASYVAGAGLSSAAPVQAVAAEANVKQGTTVSAAAAAVKAEIAALLGKNETLQNKAAVDKARVDYNCLTSKDRTAVGSISNLTASETKLRTLITVKKATVGTEITKLPKVVTAENTAAVLAVKDHFDALLVVDQIALGTTANANLKKAVDAVKVLVPTVVAVSNVAVSTTAGIAPVLPATVNATYSNSTSKDVKVTWAAVDAAKYAAPGTFTVEGTIAESTTIKVTATVTVGPAVAVSVAKVEAIADVTVANGTTADQIGLVKTVKVTLTDGSVKNANVAWDFTGYSAGVAGTYPLTGTITPATGDTYIVPAGTKAAVKVTVNPVVLAVVASAVDEQNLKVTFTDAIDTDKLTVDNFKVTGVNVTGVNVIDSKNVVISTSDFIPTNARVEFKGLTKGGSAVSFDSISIDNSNRAVITLKSNKDVIEYDPAGTPIPADITFSVKGLPAGTEATVEFSTTWGKIVTVETTTNQQVVVKLTPLEASEIQKAIVTAKIVSVINPSTGQTFPVYKNVTPGTTEVTFKPNVAPQETGIVLSITGAVADQADRVYVNLDKPVSDALVTALNANVAAISVLNDITKNGTVAPNYKPVSVQKVAKKDADTLVLILNRADANFPLVDNAKHKVIFNYSDDVKKNYIKGSAEVFLEDSSYIKMMKVYNQTTDQTLAYNQLKIVFNEAVNDLDATKVGYESSARNLKNWVIDGLNLGTPTSLPSKDPKNINVDVVSSKGDTTERETVILTFNDIRDVKEFISDKGIPVTGHKLQVNSIGDWAAVTDSKNIVATQELQYGIVKFEKPVLSLRIDGKPEEITGNGLKESPEQFIARFSGPVNPIAFDKAFTLIVPDLHPGVVDPYGRVEANGTITKAGARMLLTVANGGITVTKIYDALNPKGVSYLVELNHDWTQDWDIDKNFDTDLTKQNYHDQWYRDVKLAVYGYTDVVDNTAIETVKGTGVAISNIVTLAQDTESPLIETATQLTFNKEDNTETYKINSDDADISKIATLKAKAGAELIAMTEPVQLQDGTNAFTILTPSQQQEIVGGAVKGSVPTVTFEYVQTLDKDGKPVVGDRTVEGRITKLTNYGHLDPNRDYSFIVEPVKDLDAGYYKLVVRSISDDIGNTMVTTIIGGTADQVIPDQTTVIGNIIRINAKEVSTALRVINVDGHHKIVGDTCTNEGLCVADGGTANGVYTNINWLGNEFAQDLDSTNDAKDIIHIEFNKNMSLLGDNSILNKNNYRLDGEPLPVDGTRIERGLKGEGKLDSNGNSFENSAMGVTIILPDGYLQEKDVEHIITIQNVVTNDGSESIIARVPLTVNGTTDASVAVSDKAVAPYKVGGQVQMHSGTVVNPPQNDVTTTVTTTPSPTPGSTIVMVALGNIPAGKTTADYTVTIAGVAARLAGGKFVATVPQTLTDATAKPLVVVTPVAPQKAVTKTVTTTPSPTPGSTIVMVALSDLPAGKTVDDYTVTIDGVAARVAGGKFVATIAKTLTDATAAPLVVVTAK